MCYVHGKKHKHEVTKKCIKVPLKPQESPGGLVLVCKGQRPHVVREYSILFHLLVS